MTASAGPGYHFVNWTEGGVVAASGATLLVGRVTSAHSLTANFAIDTFTVTFASAGHDTLAGKTTQTVNFATATVTAVPAAGYHFVNWTEAGVVVKTTAALTVTNIAKPRSFTAHFAINTSP